MAVYVVDVRHEINYKIHVDASSEKQAKDMVWGMIEENDLIEDQDEFDFDYESLDVRSAWEKYA